MKSNILIIGATSEIAQATAKIYAARGDNLFLVARNQERLQYVENDLKLRGDGKLVSLAVDLNDFVRHREIMERAMQALSEIDIVLIAHGSLPDQKACEVSFALTLQEMNINFLSAISLLTIFANYFEQRKKGCIAVITSVAGDRGRQSNYVYGTAKGALTIFLQGLRNRLAKADINILTIKPGLVDTPMTRGFNKNLLWSSSPYVGNKIVTAIDKKKSVVYVPAFWRGIMWVIKCIPEKLFCRLSL